MNTEDKAEFVQLNAMDKLRYKNDMDAFREEERKKLEQERAKEHRELASASSASASSAIASAISVAEHVAHSSISMKTV
jgi:single-stranded DNA-specific DHH superfamily exonuclease